MAETYTIGPARMTHTELETAPVEAGRPRLDEPLVAVVIPAYKQPGYLQDALRSVLRQSMRASIRTVIVNDGCPYASTDEVCRLFSGAYPDEVFYLRKDNGGLSSARNRGVRFALDAWPTVQAVFPLDADNVLSPHTIETLWRSLRDSPEDTGWTYHDLQIMGADDAAWRTTTSFSAYRLAFENLCDAGALIHRRVFEAGVWYDETMKRGYEDWEHYLHAALNGFRGIHVPDTGFFYRLTGHSMLTDARREHEDIYQFILNKHASGLRPRRLTELEHDELPRFALVELDRDRVRWTTNPHGADQSTMSTAEYFDAMAEWHARARPKDGYIPPVTVISHAPVIEQLRRLRILPGLLFDMQALAAHHDCTYLNFERADNPYLLTLNRADRPSQPVAVAVPTRRLIEVGRQVRNRLHSLVRGEDGFGRAGITLSAGLAHVIHAGGPLQNYRSSEGAAAPHENVIDAADELLSDLSKRVRATRFSPARQQMYEDTRRYAAPNAYFAAQQQLDRGLGTFPYFASRRDGASRGTGIWFVAPWIRLGGVDQIVLNLARQIAALCPAFPIHLLLTSAGEVETGPEALDVFDTISFLAAGEGNKEDELLKVLAGADIIFNAHSQAVYDGLAQLKSATAAPIVSLLQLIDPTQFGVLAGYPVLASRQYAPVIDHFVVPSQRLKRTCINFGVPEEKILVVPNAPAVRPPTLDSALGLARDKALRTFSGDHPVRILFAGRFDEQKGFDRLGPIVGRLQQLGVPFELRVIGKAVLTRGDANGALPGATVLAPTHEPAALARHYTDADVFLLPSRWEGVPLTVLEAMSFGAVVVATDVGAIDEVVDHGTNGFLVDPDLSEQEIAAECARLIAGIEAGSLVSGELRANAVRAAMSFNWRDAAARLAALIDTSGLD